MNGVKLPPIQQRLMDILGDGLVHKKKQLLACIDEQADINSLKQHIHKLRTILRRESALDIMAYNGEGYRLVRVISSEE